jgi:DNA polymerase I-like protein with 3'-5' exonuclease and polymerase domains
LPADNPVYLGYPTWFIVPSPTKDDSDDEGGQIQARPSVKSPPALKFHPAIRNAYRSRWPGGVIVKWDQSQHELRTAAMLSGDEYLTRAYTSDPPIDLHTDRARQIFGKDIEKHPLFKRVYRQAGKHANFTDLNRGGALLLLNTIFKKSDGVIVPLSLCREIVADRRTQRPGLIAWQDRLIRHAKKHHYVELPFTGHSRHFLPGAKHEDSMIVNFPIQAIAALTVWAIEHIFCTEHLPNINDPQCDRFLFLNHYDALFTDCRNKEVALEVVDSLQSSMEHVQNAHYWAWWTELTGHEIPLLGDWSLIDGPETI